MLKEKQIGKQIILPVETQKAIAAFFLRTSIPRILADRKNDKEVKVDA